MTQRERPPRASSPEPTPPTREWDAGEETEMNMTPMIDIVFQLIIFFLLSLKFKTVDERIDSRLPRDRGPAPTQAHPPELLKIKVKLFRKNKGLEAEAYTLVRVGNSAAHAFKLPPGPWPRESDAAEAYRRSRDAVFARIRTVIDRQFAGLDRDPKIVGEIVAPPPDGGAVPHGDVIRILDTFVQVGLEQILFEGVRAPLPRSEGGRGP